MIDEIEKIVKKYRNFDPKIYVEQKVSAINDFFAKHQLDSCVVGMSGGIDSSLVYWLLDRAKRVEGSPIKCVVPVIAPVYSKGTTNQSYAVLDAYEFLEFCGYEYTGYVKDLTKVSDAYLNLFNYRDVSNWAVGQLASILRTPLFYFEAALLQEDGYRSIVVGTTNKDEGSYIGFYGKASDGMVDLQPIADIHKNEIYEIAHEFLFPKNIIRKTPKGDVYDGRTDEQMIGAPYWFLYIYLNYITTDFIKFEIDKILNIYPTLKRDFFAYASNVEELHNKNYHKYQVGMPSHFIDVLERHVKNGW